MSQYIMHSEYASYVAMDVHSRSITAHAVNLKTSEVRTKRFTNAPTADQIADWAKSWLAEPIYFAYESGPCGFQLQRDFKNQAC